MEKVEILGVPFDYTTNEGIVETLTEKMKRQEKTFVVTANPEIVMYAVKHPNYMETLQSADHIIPDGAGIIIGSKIIGQPLPERVAGFDLMKNLLQIANNERVKVFFLGAREEIVKRMIINIEKDYPNLHIAGYHHGFFPDDDKSIVKLVQEADADFVFVALGYPRQENWIKENLPGFQKGIFMGVGGSFDILAGEMKRAPAFWRKLNLEWFYRLLQQPSRWKRMSAIPMFVKEVIKSKRTK